MKAITKSILKVILTLAIWGGIVALTATTKDGGCSLLVSLISLAVIAGAGKAFEKFFPEITNEEI